MRKINEIFSKSTLKNMALKIVHYALIALALAICIAYLYWRWRRVNNQNKALEAELRLIQPYNNMAAISEDMVVPEAVPMKPVAAPAPVAPAPEPVVNASAPPVITPKPMTAIKEEEPEEPVVGIPPVAPVADPMFVDISDPVVFVNMMSAMPPLEIETSKSSIVELPDETPEPAESPVVDPPVVELEDKPEVQATTTRRRRK